MHTIESTATESTWRRAARSWWQVGAVLIATGSAIVAIDIIVRDPGPIWKRSIGFTLLALAAALVVVGLLVRRASRDHGSTMVAVGVVPGIAPIVFFWFPPAVLVGLIGIAVFVAAINDAAAARREVALERTR